jgi:hypothetical protein
MFIGDDKIQVFPKGTQRGEHTIYIELEGRNGDGHFAMVNKADHHKVEGSRWGLTKGYATRKRKREDGKWGTEYMHRVVTDAPTGTIVNHREKGSTLDNRRKNLKVTDYGENNADRVSSGKSGRKGVFETRGGRYTAVKQWQGHAHYLGTFDSAEEASKEYMQFSAFIGHEIHTSKVATTRDQN